MIKKRIALIFITIPLLFIALSKFNSALSAEFRTESNKVITNVGNPPVDTTLVSGAFSCPLKGTRVIGCGSFMSDPKFNRLDCLKGANPADRGHCNRTGYSKCYKGDEITKNSRRGNSIDVDGTVGEAVYLPTIEGKTVEWNHIATFGPLSRNDGEGFGHVFNSRVENNTWTLFLIHVDSSLTSPPTGKYRSGDQATTIAATDYTHVHINIGKNPTSLDFGPGWLSPENLGMCVN